MKNLARHIELLLRDNDCVILPGFGGFIAHDVPAYYVSEEGLYYPPSRSISFNASITMNDGLLAQSYMKSYQVDYARATHIIDVAVEQLTDMLDEEGSVTMPHIGTLTHDIHQSLQFIPDVAGIASPKHFGLGSFAIKELGQLLAAEANPQAAVTHTAKTINLRIRKDVLHRVISTAAIFLLLIMVALPTGDHKPTDVAALRLAELVASPQIRVAEPTPVAVPTETVVASEDTAQVMLPVMKEEPTPAPVAVEVAPVVPETPTVVTGTPAVAAPTVETPQPTTGEVKPMKTYHIIVASLPNHRGADETLAQYARMGYADVALVERDNRVRISLMQFADKDEANAQLKTLRTHDEFQNAWMLAVRE